ncbi:MAG: metal ABC transporter ATP-binding protein [Ignavibacteria bacterium]|jgi:zinc transport system ATP-binding protein
MNPLIKIENLSFSYGKEEILQNINFIVEERDYIGMIGPNGGGKTTLLKLIVGLLKPGTGKITINNGPVFNKNLIGYIPQFGSMEENFPIKVRDTVAMGICGAKSYLPWFNKNDQIKIEKAMDHVSINNLAGVSFNELSGGQKQRVLIARALVSDPQILLLDEPTSSVDNSSEMDIYELLKNLNRDKTIILASHDLGFISSYVNKVACINKNLVVHKIDEVSSETIIKDAYNNSVNMINHKCGL